MPRPLPNHLLPKIPPAVKGTLISTCVLAGIVLAAAPRPLR